MHTHSEAIEAVSTLSDGVALLSQNGGGFFEGIAYHEWEGMSTDWEEQASIAADVAAHERTHTLLMRNHGACTFGASVGQAWVRMYYLDIICRVALNALSTGQPLRIPDESEALCVPCVKQSADCCVRLARLQRPWPTHRRNTTFLAFGTETASGEPCVARQTA